MTQQPELIILKSRQEDNHYDLTLNTWAYNGNNEYIPISIKGIVKMPEWLVDMRMPFEFVTQENGGIYDVIVREEK